jgi:hypothetical protein
MTAKIIDGKAIAADLRGKVADAVHRLSRDRGITPGLAVVLVGNNPASESYVASKIKMTAGSGMRSFDHRLPKETSEAELLGLIARLNADPTVHGILVQLPLPSQIDAHKIIAAVDPAKDVDGFNPVNAGRLSAGLPGLAPCTPVGCILLAKTVQPSLLGLETVVIGRSNIVGKPLAHRRRRGLHRSRADRWRDHAGAGWRRADDYRLPARQHGPRGVRYRRPGGTGVRSAPERRPGITAWGGQDGRWYWLRMPSLPGLTRQSIA